MLTRLGVAEQMVDEGGVYCPEQPFQRRPEAWLRRGALVRALSIKREKLFKVHAPELWPSINRNGRGESSIPLDTPPHHHHGRAVGRRIEGQVKRSNAPGIREDHEREPAFAQELVRFGIAELEIDFQMVNVRHRPGVAPMPMDGFFGGVVRFLERGTCSPSPTPPVLVSPP